MASTSSSRNTPVTSPEIASGSIICYLYTLEESSDFDKVVFLPKTEVELDFVNSSKGSVLLEDDRIPVAVLFDDPELTPEQLMIIMNAEKLDSAERKLLVQMGRIRSAKLLQENAPEVNEEYRNIKDAFPEEEEKLKSLHSLSEPNGEEVTDATGSCSNQPGRLDSLMDLAADQAVVVWESPFQYAKLSVTPADRIIHETSTDNLRASLAEFQQSGSLCDLKIRGSGSTSAISCHSVVLCALSSVIKTQICSKLHHGSELNFAYIPHEILIQLVDYAYTGSMQLGGVNVLSVYSAADFLGIEVLMAAASTFLLESTEMFDGVSCYKILRFLEQHDRLQLLIPMYKRRLVEHLPEVFKSLECLMDMSIEFVIEFLESDFVDFGPETDVIRALNRWVSVDSSRDVFLPELALRIRWKDIERDPPSKDVEPFIRKLQSVRGSNCDQPKIGSRTGGMSAGFLLYYNKGDYLIDGEHLILDIQSQKIKVLPTCPDLLYEGDYRSVMGFGFGSSDDGSFYIFSDSDDVGNFDVFRLNALEQRWDHLLQHQSSSGYPADNFYFLAGKLFLYFSGDHSETESSHVECLDLTTSKVESIIALDGFVPCGNGCVASSSIFFRDKFRNVTRFDAKSHELSRVTIDLPSDLLGQYVSMQINATGQALLLAGDFADRPFWLCLESGRLKEAGRSCPAEASVVVQDSVISLRPVKAEPSENTYGILEVLRDRGPSEGWNIVNTYHLTKKVEIVCGFHYPRAMIKDLPEFK